MTEPQRGSTIYSQNANKMNPASSIENWTLAKSAVKRRDGEKEMLTTEKTDSTEVNFGLLGTHKIGGFPTREFHGSGPAMWLATGCRSGGGMWRSGKIRSTEKNRFSPSPTGPYTECADGIGSSTQSNPGRTKVMPDHIRNPISKASTISSELGEVFMGHKFPIRQLCQF